jgi:hypothetical protein
MYESGRGGAGIGFEVVAGPIPPGRTVYVRRVARVINGEIHRQEPRRGACGATLRIGDRLRVMVYFAGGDSAEYDPRELLTEDDVLADALAGEVFS